MLLDIENLSLTITANGLVNPILDDVSLTVDAGEVVGLVGESGSGKSTTARAVLRLYPETAAVEGSITVGETEVLAASRADLHRVRSSEVAMIHQDPRAALNPVRRIGDSLTERLVHVLGVSRSEAAAAGLELLEAVGIRQPEERMRQYPHELSGGMLQRVVIAAALTGQPKLLLADEATSALDVTTQAEVLAILRDLQSRRGLGVLLITHDLHLAAAYCDRVYVMYRGRIVEELRGRDLFHGAQHEYTRQLLAAVPAIGHLPTSESRAS
ncbi:ABC transporter ATP-binding protein [Arthrobacter sp. MYb23]|uniref:ABC transporter ATP-binding protein n=1 Tax=unclassified Arthrobacter TaxID=235627 RepID=UPI000CFABC99|nr:MULTISPECIES: ABC transporter ATP-binding protein [unclassified Arthrobacter]PRB43742.1 ABC transporter ATP-binding protein [Arthrobacter sp. MYb51]PRB97348.1 ABC transporter ATP-binding protein [Arthrobacter sp. MYb23]